MIIVARSKITDLDPGNPLHRMQLGIDWPEGAISASRGHRSQPWRFYTIADKLAKKRKRNEERLWIKREYGVVRKVALYAWVFWCPGINFFIYRGWWTYLVGRGISYGVDFRGGSVRLQSRLMELFPVGDRSLFGDFGEWKAEFVKRYQRGCRSGKPQGKAPVWAEVAGGGVKRLLSRAEWPHLRSRQGSKERESREGVKREFEI